MKSILRHPIVTSLLGWIIWFYMALCGRTIRWIIEGDEAAKAAWLSESGTIIAAWHSSILLLPSGWNRAMRKWPPEHRDVAMLISLSRDGEPVAKAIKHLGLKAIRGSSAHKSKQKDKGGLRALTNAIRLLREGGAVCITPDGPRGPAEIAQTGPIVMAQRTGAPIIPYAVTSLPAKRLSTWDRFHIPYPFSKGAIVFGAPLIAEPNMSVESLRTSLEERLTAAMRRAEAMSK